MERTDAAPRPLTREQATQLAADILDVAQFYSLPLDYFLGVGAMENDYMDVNGDLTHAVWKKRAQRDDIILRRGRKRVMVSDYAMGTWQITRETLRAAHQLYLHDKRDYTLLPARLPPPRRPLASCPQQQQHRRRDDDLASAVVSPLSMRSSGPPPYFCFQASTAAAQ